MATKFYVIDEENNCSYSEKLDAAENFSSLASAKKRAFALAETEPGQKFFVCKAVSIVTCPVGEPEIIERVAPTD